ncbi:MAG: cellulase family glycosylhydrolase [Candidatus Azobacteroides sp.]|nr:cellulase family glycosylhydrolase [Candidatus Azobacteroides sp.]
MKYAVLSQLFKLMLFSASLVCSLQLSASGYLRTQGKEIINDRGPVLLRGIGLGGWVLQEPYMLGLSGIARTQQEIKSKITDVIGEKETALFYENWINNGVTKKDIDSLAAWGFNSIRFPMHYNIFTLPVEQEPVKGKNTWLEKGFQLTDSLLSWCEANQLYLFLDLHAAPGGQGNDVAISDASEIRLWNDVENKKKTIALWQELAKRYVNSEWVGGYDIINEPNYGFQDTEDKNGCKEELNEPLRELMVEITKAIREIDNKHMIIISGNCWGNNYQGIFPLWDDNMVISFHKYWNYNDKESIERMLAYREEQHAPLWLSESGENSTVWFTDAIRLMEENNIGWCWWTYKRMGLACPMEIKSPEGYEKVKHYWETGDNKPSKEEALKTFTRLTENYKIENTLFHKDYIDALFRQVRTTETIPFRNHFLKDGQPLTVFATDYDMGRSGYAYHDNDSANYRSSTDSAVPGNRGGLYRNDGVDIISCEDEITNRYCVSYTEPGEWIQYTIYTDKEGIYNLKIRTTTASSGEFYFTINEQRTPTVALPENPEKKWYTSEIRTIRLMKGENKIRIYIEKGDFDFNYFQLIP